MAIWNAHEVDAIGNSEFLGRRRFKHPELRGAAGQKTIGGLDARDFEVGKDREVSIDRLGRSSIDPKVLKYLRPRAEAHGNAFRARKEFLGWACVQAGKFRESTIKHGYQLKVSPVAGIEPNDNNYHAHISCPDTLEPIYAALLIRDLFERLGTTHDVDHVKGEDSPVPSWRQALSSVWKRLFPHR